MNNLSSSKIVFPQRLSARLSHHITFCLDNSYFEFNIFYKQNSGGTIKWAPLIVELSEIRTAELNNKPLPPSLTLL